MSCGICYDAPATFAFDKCNHLILCNQCNIEYKSTECCMCRTVSHRRKVFTSDNLDEHCNYSKKELDELEIKRIALESSTHTKKEAIKNSSNIDSTLKDAISYADGIENYVNALDVLKHTFTNRKSIYTNFNKIIMNLDNLEIITDEMNNVNTLLINTNKEYQDKLLQHSTIKDNILKLGSIQTHQETKQHLANMMYIKLNEIEYLKSLDLTLVSAASINNTYQIVREKNIELTKFTDSLNEANKNEEMQQVILQELLRIQKIKTEKIQTEINNFIKLNAELNEIGPAQLAFCKILKNKQDKAEELSALNAFNAFNIRKANNVKKHKHKKKK